MEAKEKTGTKWRKVERGIQVKEHPTRKHGIKPDIYFMVRHSTDGREHKEALGWASDGWTLEKARIELSRLRMARGSGDGHVTMREKRAAASEARRVNAERNITLGMYWREHYGPSASATKKRETWRREESAYRSWLELPLGDRPLRSIQPRDLEKIRQDMAAEGKKPRTIQHVFLVLRALWTHARKWGVLDAECPTKGVSLGRIDNARARFLSPTELHDLLEEVHRRDSNAWELVLTAAHTGARLGELSALTWANVDLKGSTMSLVHTKSGKARTVPLSKAVGAMLKEKSPGNPGQRVFLNANGGPWKLAPTAFRRAVEALGLNSGREDAREKVCFHSLRHSAATLMLDAGVDIRTVQAICGWETLAMLQRYTHPGHEAKARAVATLDAAVAVKPGKVVPIRKQARS